MPKNNYPEKFDPRNLNTQEFFSEVAIYLSLHVQRNTQKLKEKDYEAITHASNILKETSRTLRKPRSFSDILDNNVAEFFWRFYGEKKEETDIKESRKLSADRLAILSDKLSMVNDLPQGEIEKLCNTCSKLSLKTGEYRNSKIY